jgi:hypothetical protein
MRPNAFHLEEALKKEDNRGGAICNYATIWRILFPLYRVFLPRTFAPGPQYSWRANTFRPQSAALHMGISKARAHGYNVCASLRPHHTCGDGVGCIGMTVLFMCLVLLFGSDLIDFYLLGGLYISQFDIEIRSQTHKVGDCGEKGR